jgi:transcriptional regulator with XRE-family HTH domain
MYASDVVRDAFALRREGWTQRAIADRTGVSLGQLRKWLRRGEAAELNSPMRRLESLHGDGSCQRTLEAPGPQYAYLLGQYLGDGSIARMRRDVFKLSVTTCDDYPAIRAECADALRAVMPGRAVMSVRKAGCSDLYCYSKHWPCLFPQHGPGKKHRRPIVLEPWQAHVALHEHPRSFLRGLVHSDGCRFINAVSVRGKRYEYVRYNFSNRSDDIRGLFVAACEQIGVDCRSTNAVTVSVSRRADVALLDSFIGPKT